MNEQAPEAALSNLLAEDRTFPPSAEFAAAANLTADAYERAEADPEAWWAEQARRLSWSTPFTQVLDFSDAPHATWFADGKLNVAYNCADRHVEAGNGDKVAIHWEGEPGDARTITYSQLKDEVSKTANALLSLGLNAGDRVAIYLPMIPEAVFSMLACARLGLAHSVIFGGFSAEALRTRIADASARLVITSDGQYRRGSAVPLKAAVDDAVATEGSPVEHVLVVNRTGLDVAWTEKDIWWHDLVDEQSTEHVPEGFPAEQPLFILYTSGTTGKPKGILHTSGGYLTQVAFTHHAVFDLKPETDVFWCTADIGWVTGHSYNVYGPLANGATEVIYEGTPNTPDEGRHWEIIDKYGVTIYYTAPTLIRTFMKWGAEIPARYKLDSLRVLGSVGESINPEAWMWYRTHIGHDRCPIVDTWWQTETGAMMISPLPGVTATKPGSAMRALPGIAAQIVNDEGVPVGHGEGGYLVIAKPWPAMLRTIWGDDERYRDTYWSRFASHGYYFAGDGAKYDSDGALWLLGRVDDVMNVSGHRISTTEVESALVAHPSVAEAAVVGANDALTGQGIVAFVILRGDATARVADGGPAAGETLVAELRKHVATQIGPIARPRQIMIVPELPKTRSGKIMRRLLRDVAENRDLGDVTTLQDSAVMGLITSGLSTGKSDA
ncbi:acetyl-coenzyme A synthetase [Nakamurella panacisegetis]|uniref:Acetyl-coenzyme A synthetase n=1 Tax=Nakamurella panacisegetis TaxID=1090615 RepID=A0A1H0N9B4_9ACTN|nr:acetate--CoA ligase [Nakamurella panacisegetis]SDO89273.1 acetyl-coenzyme A synthetase [Nakamurella panacisegetis]